MTEKPFTEQNTIMDRAIVPEPIYDERPEFIDLYYAAWQSAWTHIFTCPGAPVQTYMNEGIRIHKIWIWDTCFMVHFCRYAAKVFPGIQSLDNFYRVIHDGESMVLKVHIPDNPPLFAWTEFENMKPNQVFSYSVSPTAAEFFPGKGFHWNGGKSGMDNTPRGRGDFTSVYWLDISAQQGLSALYISRLASVLGEDKLAEKWMNTYLELKDFVNKRFWSEKDNMYYDRKIDESGFCTVLTPASAWPMLAEMCDEQQAKALADAYLDPNRLGGERPVPSVSRNDPDFDPKGGYWRGGIWMPTLYMSTKAFEKYGYIDLADSIADRMISLQYRTWRDVEPHTIWECYSPTEDLPSTNKEDAWSRPDFCGWSALGPISLFIENLLGVRDVNVMENRVTWTPHSSRRNGVKRLMMGENSISLLADPAIGIVTVDCAKPFTLRLNGADIHCRAGKSEHKL